MTFTEFLDAIPDDVSPATMPEVEHKPCCKECGVVLVEHDGELCETCHAEMARGYIATAMVGRLANERYADHGRLSHARKRDGQWWSHSAVCGATPGRRSVGWSSYHDDAVTCPRCLKRLATEAGAK